MKKTKTLFLVCCISLFGIGGYAQPTLYSGASLPTEQSWNEWKLDATVNTAAAPVTVEITNGKLKFTSENAPNQFSQIGWYRNDLSLDLSKGYTIEIKAKVISASKNGAFNIQGFDNEGKGFRLSIKETAFANQSNPLQATTVVGTESVTNTDAFHKFRIAVAPNGTATLYRDAETIGTFPLSAFQFDNIIENGGFEDVNAEDLTDASYFPDFVTQNGLLYLSNTAVDNRTGEHSLILDNNGHGEHNHSAEMDRTYTRDLAIKPNTEYEISIHRRRTAVEPYGWRDIGLFYNGQIGMLGLAGVDEDRRNEGDKPMYAALNDRAWQVHNQTFTTLEDKQSLRFEFPTFNRDNGKVFQTAALDYFIFREKSPFVIGQPADRVAHGIDVPAFPAEYVNLIQNGDFEDVTLNNDGTPYEWALASIPDPADPTNTNKPCADNPIWGNNVRIQDVNKADDFNPGDEFYAHSGTKALRFTSLDNNAKNIDFRVELEPNKTYRFNFWHRSPQWPDKFWLRVRIGEPMYNKADILAGNDNDIWRHLMGNRSNKWTNVDLVFTTTEENHTLHLYTTSETHGGWYNQYFDDFVLYEVTEDQPANPLDTALAGKTNLIENGDFEDATKNNDGTDFTWRLASEHAVWDDIAPISWNPVWNGYVRLQDKEKRNNGDEIWGDRDDSGIDFAHSGTKSLRIQYWNEWDPARNFEYRDVYGLDNYPGDTLANMFQRNFNFTKELEPNKTYTFVFWFKASCWDDKGTLALLNGDIRVWDQSIGNKWMNWTRHQITFSTTEANHTLHFVSEFGGWMSGYLDDLFLYEEDEYVPYEASGDSYLFFGKSQNTAGAEVEVEYVKAYSSGAYAPGEETFSITYNADGGTGATNSTYEAEGAAITLPTLTKEGYTFQGWYDNGEFTGEAVTEIPEGSLGDKAFWAKWQIITYTITYHLNQGTGAENATYTIESETITLPVPVREGYNFLGWYINDRFAGAPITQIEQGSTGDKNYYAKWELQVGINNVNVEKLRVYPNPVTDGQLTLDNLSKGGKIEVRNVVGTLANVYDITGKTMTIDLSTLPAGTYIVKTNGQIAKILKK
ncbi:MAG: InlB B-repeat-containing protein [Candidatus Symbiothrix sp.]|jgi:uncharacterized repeat protein (TIGR02543 family)|nr:InlB B-repeat-containing protein [Candidatus Symbiothrix sp.]